VYLPLASCSGDCQGAECVTHLLANLHRNRNWVMTGAYELVRACEALGAGEILLNCMDKDGTNSGFDLGAFEAPPPPPATTTRTHRCKSAGICTNPPNTHPCKGKGCCYSPDTHPSATAELVRDIKSAVSIPVIASSGAGCAEHFAQVFREAKPDAALAAGIFHRCEVPISAVKSHLAEQGITTRPVVGQLAP